MQWPQWQSARRVGDAAIDTTGERNVPFRSSGFQLNNTRPREKSYIGTFPLSSAGSIANQKFNVSGTVVGLHRIIAYPVNWFAENGTTTLFVVLEKIIWYSILSDSKKKSVSERNFINLCVRENFYVKKYVHVNSSLKFDNGFVRIGLCKHVTCTI